MVQRREGLESALERSGGRALVLIHPLFHDYHPEAYLDFRSPTGTVEGRKYLETQKRALNETSLPVIVFEEKHLVETTQKLLPKNVFFVPTKAGKSTPDAGWEKMIAYLRERGLKQAVVGGQMLVGRRKQELVVTNRAEFDDLMSRTRLFSRNLAAMKKYDWAPVEGCVGGAITNFLRGNIKVSLMTRAVYPNKPK